MMSLKKLFLLQKAEIAHGPKLWGESSLRLEVLKDGGNVNIWGYGCSPIRFPTGDLIFNDIRFVDWLDRWKEKIKPK